MLLKYLLLFASLIFSFGVYAQIESAPPMGNSHNSNELQGKVIDLQNSKPITAATVQIYIPSPKGDSLIAAMLTRSNGDFKFEKLPSADTLKLIVSFVGHTNVERIISFASQGTPSQLVNKDIGNIILPRNTETLEGVVVTGLQPKMKLGIDKKIFDVGQTLTASGGTAVDVMKSIPSLSVDVEGNVEFRNSSPTIFIDGRPTVLTLEQIPADDIDRVELISNPSAKYDASSGGGIVNIILKKNKRKGLNGMVSLTGGLPETFRGSANLNLRQGKLNFFLSGSYSSGNSDAKESSDRKNFKDGIVQDYFNQKSINGRGRAFKSIRGGVDYFIDNRNTITFSQGFVQGNFTNHEAQDQKFLDQNKDLTRYGDRVSDSKHQFTRNSSQIFFTHQYPKTGKKLDVSAQYNYGGSESEDHINNQFFYPDDSEAGLPNVVRNEGDNDDNEFTASVDLVNPINDHTKIETGLRTNIKDYSNIFNTYSLTGGGEIKLPLSNNYKYLQQIHAAYITYTGMMGSIGYQLGLRGEYSNFDGTLVDSAQKFGYEYPSKLSNIWDALFPSVFLSKKINERDEIQINYSRRVRRPNFWQISPFIDIEDPLNLEKGNPGLRPEFRNSFEFNYSNNYGSNSNFLAALYYRNNMGDITRYSDTLTAEQFAQLHNSAVDPNAILNTYINSQSSNQLGLELTLQQKFSNLEITPSASLSYRKVNANVNDLNLSNEGFNWRGEVRANYKVKSERSALFRNMSFEFSGEYESPEVLPQGRNLEQFEVDLGLRKDILDKKGTITFSVDDLFNTDKHGTVYDTESFYQESFRRWRVRSFRLTFSYKFGNSDFTLFKRHNTGGSGGEDIEGGGPG
jgi:outer membrane receptor protein involved in Fe transport